MRIKNWKKISDNCWKLNVANIIKNMTLHWRSMKPKIPQTIVCFKKGYSGDWVVMGSLRILRHAKTMVAAKRKAISWMRRHPNG